MARLAFHEMDGLCCHGSARPSFSIVSCRLEQVRLAEGLGRSVIRGVRETGARKPGTPPVPVSPRVSPTVATTPIHQTLRQPDCGMYPDVSGAASLNMRFRTCPAVLTTLALLALRLSAADSSAFARPDPKSSVRGRKERAGADARGRPPLDRSLLPGKGGKPASGRAHSHPLQQKRLSQDDSEARFFAGQGLRRRCAGHILLPVVL